MEQVWPHICGPHFYIVQIIHLGQIIHSTPDPHLVCTPPFPGHVRFTCLMPLPIECKLCQIHSKVFATCVSLHVVLIKLLRMKEEEQTHLYLLSRSAMLNTSGVTYMRRQWLMRIWSRSHENCLHLFSLSKRVLFKKQVKRKEYRS